MLYFCPEKIWKANDSALCDTDAAEYQIHDMSKSLCFVILFLQKPTNPMMLPGRFRLNNATTCRSHHAGLWNRQTLRRSLIMLPLLTLIPPSSPPLLLLAPDIWSCQPNLKPTPSNPIVPKQINTKILEFGAVAVCAASLRSALLPCRGSNKRSAANWVCPAKAAARFCVQPSEATPAGVGVQLLTVFFFLWIHVATLPQVSHQTRRMKEKCSFFTEFQKDSVHFFYTFMGLLIW